VVEDFLDTINVTLHDFCTEMTGGWLFGYVEALQSAGVRSVLICISRQVDKPVRATHVPTGATISFLPVPRIYRFLRRRMCNPYGWSAAEMFGEARGVRRLVLTAVRDTSFYLTTPLRLLAGELRRQHCSAVVCQEYEFPRFDACVLVGQVMRLPVFASFQGGDYQRSRIERFVRPIALRGSDGLVIASCNEIQRVRKHYHVPAAKIARIFNPLDLELYGHADREEARAALHIPSEAKVVVWHGRISMHQKGLDVLLDAWQQVCRERPGQDLRLLLLGTGEDAEAFGRRMEDIPLRGISWDNRYVHDRDLIRQYLGAGDLYVFPSRHEGFPVALVEAMACGLPVVAADAQGVADILKEGERSGGLVVPRGNAVALAAATGRVLDDEAWGRELGQRARRRVEERFSLQSVGEQLRAFLLHG